MSHLKRKCVVIIATSYEKNVLLSCVAHIGGQAQHFFESAIAMPQLKGSSSAIAILKLLKEFVASPLGKSAIAIFSDVRNFKFAT